MKNPFRHDQCHQNGERKPYRLYPYGDNLKICRKLQVIIFSMLKMEVYRGKEGDLVVIDENSGTVIVALT